MYKAPVKAQEEVLAEDGLDDEISDLDDQDDEEEVEPEKERRNCEQEVIAFKDLLAAFESKHSLDELNAIVDLTPAEARLHPVREPARQGLIPILNTLNVLGAETDISLDDYGTLYARYRRLSMAVGTINNNKVRHQ